MPKQLKLYAFIHQHPTKRRMVDPVQMMRESLQRASQNTEIVSAGSDVGLDITWEGRLGAEDEAIVKKLIARVLQKLPYRPAMVCKQDYNKVQERACKVRVFADRSVSIEV